MEKREIGSTGLAVTPLCFGTSSLGGMPGTYGYDVDEARARATLHAIFDGPVNFLDTSNNYAGGRSEARIGAVLKERGGVPPGTVLATKLDRDMATGRFDAARARRSLEESLERLGLDSIDLLHFHDPEHAADLDEIERPGGGLDEIFRMKEEGLARAVGLAMGPADLQMRLIEGRSFDAIISHNRFTLLNASADALFTRAHERGIAVLNAAPYAGGVLAKGSATMPRVTYQEASGEALEPVRRVEAVCTRHGVEMGAVALQHSMRDPRITSTIVGVTKPERVAQTLSWASAAVPDEAWAELDALPRATDDPEASRVYDPS